MILKHEFVEYIPDDLAEGTIYVSIVYKTALHRCVCGCGIEVVTPISPTDWQLAFDGDSISLHPSIGNWSFPCRSHYWIKHNEIIWAPSWSQNEIEAGRKMDGLKKREYYKSRLSPETPQAKDAVMAKATRRKSGAVTRVWNWLRTFFGVF